MADEGESLPITPAAPVQLAQPWRWPARTKAPAPVTGSARDPVANWARWRGEQLPDLKKLGQETMDWDITTQARPPGPETAKLDESMVGGGPIGLGAPGGAVAGVLRKPPTGLTPRRPEVEVPEAAVQGWWGQPSRESAGLTNFEMKLADEHGIPPSEAHAWWQKGGPKQTPPVVAQSQPPPGVRGFLPPSATVASEPGYHYHATNLDNAQEIAQSGKLTPHSPWHGTDQAAWPDGGQEKRIYFTPKAGVAHSFAPAEGKPVLLRVSEKYVPHRERGTGDTFARKPIPAKYLEIAREDGTWAPLPDAFPVKR